MDSIFCWYEKKKSWNRLSTLIEIKRSGFEIKFLLNPNGKFKQYMLPPYVYWSILANKNHIPSKNFKFPPLKLEPTFSWKKKNRPNIWKFPVNLDWMWEKRQFSCSRKIIYFFLISSTNNSTSHEICLLSSPKKNKI